MKKAFRIIPIIYFMFLSMFWIAEFYLSLGVINYTAIIVFVLLLVQLFHNQKYAGLAYGTLLTAFSIYMLVDTITGYKNTPVINNGHFRFLIIKCTFFGMALLLSVMMVYYYINLSSINQKADI